MAKGNLESLALRLTGTYFNGMCEKEQWRGELAAVEKLLLLFERPDFARYISSCAIDKGERRSYTLALFSSLVGLPLATLLSHLVATGSPRLVERALQALRERLQRALGLFRVEIASAQALEPEFLSYIEERLEQQLGGKVELVQKETPELLGGAVVTYGGEWYDFTVRRGLEKIQYHLMEVV